MSEFCGGKAPSAAFQAAVLSQLENEDARKTATYAIKVSDSDLKARLDPVQFCVSRECGTEDAFSGRLLNVKGNGRFDCVICQVELFSTETKFDSGTGWPSFTRPDGALRYFADYSIEGRPRVEVVCGQCGGHLGHVFDDGPGGKLRYCINSVCLDFKAGK